jgi:hypothetical protein
MKTRSIALATLFLFLALGLAWLGIHRARAAQEQLAALAQKQATLNDGIERAQSRITSDASNRARVLASLKKLRAAAASKAPAGGGLPNRLLVLIATNPKLLDLYLKSYRASLVQRYGPFYQQAGLSPDQIAKFEDALAKREEAKMDLIGTAVAQGLSNSDPSVMALNKEQIAQLRTDQTAALGDAGYEQLQEYNRQQVAVNQAKAAANFALDNAPYTNAQVGQLAQVLANASENYQEGGPVDQASIDWNSALTQATTFLSPPQLDALRAQAQWGVLGKLINQYYSQAAGK